MTEGITVVASGVVIDGIITSRSHRFIEVEITSPFAGLRTDLTIPLFAAGRTTFLGRAGDRTAVALLRRVFSQAEYMTVYRDELKEEWQHVKRLLHELREIDPGADDEMLRKERLELRHHFKRGRLTQSEYQVELKRLMQLRNVYEDRERKLIDSFLKEWSCGLDLEQVLAFIGES